MKNVNLIPEQDKTFITDKKNELDDHKADVYDAASAATATASLRPKAVENYSQSLITEICNEKILDPEKHKELLKKLFDLTKGSSEETNAQVIENIIKKLPPREEAPEIDRTHFMDRVLGPLVREYKLLEGVDPAIYVSLFSTRLAKEYNNRDQEAFAGWMHIMAKHAETLLRIEPVKFDEMLQKMGALRLMQDEAVRNKEKEENCKFGNLRYRTLYTPIRGIYLCIIYWIICARTCLTMRMRMLFM